MRKLVLGIIAIGLAQFAFINYLGLNDPMELAAAPGEPRITAASEVISQLPSADEPAETEIPAEDDGVLLEPARAVYRSHRAFNSAERRLRPSRQGRVRSAIRRDIAPEASNLDFETVVIRYHAGSKRPDCGSDDVAKPKNRPLTAETAVPAANRPWQVITTFGAKFN